MNKCPVSNFWGIIDHKSWGIIVIDNMYGQDKFYRGKNHLRTQNENIIKEQEQRY